MADPEITTAILREIRDVLRVHTTRFDQLDRRLDKVEQRLDKVEQRLDKVEQRLDKVEQRLDKVEQRVDSMDKRLVSVEERLVHLAADVGSIRHEVTIIGRALVRVGPPVQSALERHDAEIADLQERVAKLESR